MSLNIEYFQRRAVQERDAASAALTEDSSRIHLELAVHYDNILGAMASEVVDAVGPSGA